VTRRPATQAAAIAIQRAGIRRDQARQEAAWCSGLTRREIEAIDEGCQARIDEARTEIRRLEAIPRHGCRRTNARYVHGWFAAPLALAMVA